MNTRPVSVAHLVVGIVFAGIATVWLVGEVTDVDTPGFEIWGPGLLIAAGVIGLAATLLAGRRGSTPPDATEAFAEDPVSGPNEPTTTIETMEAPTAPADDTAETIPLRVDHEEKP